MGKYLRVLMLALAALLAGCALTLDNPGEAQVRIPPCYPIYYPYEKRTERIGDVRPIPDYGGWTDARMARDVAAIAECGCAGVAVALTPPQLASEDVQGRLAHFADVASKAGLKTTVLLRQADRQPRQPMRIDAGNLASFLKQAFAGRIAGALVDSEGHPVWCYDRSSIILDGAGEAAGEAVFLAVEGLHGGDSLAVSVGGSPLLAMARVADCGECGATSRREQVWSWRQPRLEGERLVEQLRAMGAAGKSAVLIQSWNCYADGSFAERNSLDGEAVLVALKGLLRQENAKK